MRKTPSRTKSEPRAQTKSAKKTPLRSRKPAHKSAPEVTRPEADAVADSTDSGDSALTSEATSEIVPGATLAIEPDGDILSFEELGLIPELLSAVKDAGYTTPTPIQQRAIPL